MYGHKKFPSRFFSQNVYTILFYNLSKKKIIIITIIKKIYYWCKRFNKIIFFLVYMYIFACKLYMKKIKKK